MSVLAPTKSSYESDSSIGIHDLIVARAITESLPSDITLAQSDYLRVAFHLPDHKVMDFSGLNDKEIAESDDRSFAYWAIRRKPDVFIPGYRFISRRNLSESEIDSIEVGRFFTHWPPTSDPDELSEFYRMYMVASVELGEDLFFNFLILRSTAGTVTVQALWNVGTDFVLVPFAVISYALGDEAGAHEAIAA